MITVSRAWLEALIVDSHWLAALYDRGLIDWSGYETARDEYEAETGKEVPVG